MRQSKEFHRRHHEHRPGVATLELVLVLPVLLFITALIINFGVLSTWRIRGQAAARHEIWQTRWPRTAAGPTPDSWQPPARVAVEAAPAFAVLDDPAVNRPVVRGPLPAANVDADLLDFSRGVSKGTAALNRVIPVPPQMVNADISAEHPLLTGVWTYEGTKMSSNVERRIKVLYELAKAPDSLSQAYVAAVLAIYRAAYQADLVPLEREPDFPRFGHASPDFHPQLSSFCGLDVTSVHDNQVRQLVERIAGVNEPGRHVAGVPETMTRAYLALYRGALAELENQLNAQPPLPPPQRGEIERQLRLLHQELDPKIAQLEAFLSTLTQSPTP